MTKHYIYDVDEDTVLEKISQLQPLNYNQFRWWRRFDSPTKPLHKNSDLLRKIKNGDYEFSHYYWQARYAEIEINELHHETYPDAVLFNEKNAMNGSRRKRLWDDFEKDEKERMNNLSKDFYHTFKMSREQIKKEMEEFGGTLEDFYRYCNKEFGIRQQKLQTRGRPRKVI